MQMGNPDQLKAMMGMMGQKKTPSKLPSDQATRQMFLRALGAMDQGKPSYTGLPSVNGARG